MDLVKLYNGKVKIWVGPNSAYFHDLKGLPDKKRRIISVTAASGILDKSGALMGWVAKMIAIFLKQNWDLKKIQTEEQKLQMIAMAKVHYREAKEEAANIGIVAHEWIKEFIKGNKPEMPEDERVRNCINLFLEINQQLKPKWIHSERIVYSRKYDFAGRLDAVAKIKKILELVDFKTANGLYEETIIQTGGYQIAYEEETGEKIIQRRAMRFGKEDAEFEQKIYTENKKDKEAFLFALELKRWKDKNARYPTS